MQELNRFADEFGPAKILQIYEPALKLRAVVVVDNVAAGPSIGGVRMAPDVTVEECFRLARAMTLKNAAAGLRHGGGKAVIAANHTMPRDDKEQLIRAFARAIGSLMDYIPGPDMGTDEVAMAWVHDENGRAVGLPPEIGGIPLDVIGATGFGLSVAAKVAQEYCDVPIEGARVAIQGFGSVGKHAAQYLSQEGAKLVAVSDSKAALFDPNGLDIEALVAFKDQDRHFGAYDGLEARDREAVIGADCDIWIPAARPDVVQAGNVDQLKARLVVQGANIPITKDAEDSLHARGVLVIPDFIANAGGVICGAVEYAGGTQSTAFEEIEEKIRANTNEVLELAKSKRQSPRDAAMSFAAQRVRTAMSFQRWSV